MKLTAELCREGEPNIHGMQYTREVMESIVEQLSGRQFIGEFEPDYNQRHVAVDLKNASHTITNPRITEEGRLLVDIEVLKTPSGKLLEQFANESVTAIRGMSVSTDLSSRPVTIDTKVDLITVDMISPDRHSELTEQSIQDLLNDKQSQVGYPE